MCWLVILHISRDEEIHLILHSGDHLDRVFKITEFKVECLLNSVLTAFLFLVGF